MISLTNIPSYFLIFFLLIIFRLNYFVDFANIYKILNLKVSFEEVFMSFFEGIILEYVCKLDPRPWGDHLSPLRKTVGQWRYNGDFAGASHGSKRRRTKRRQRMVVSGGTGHALTVLRMVRWFSGSMAFSPAYLWRKTRRNRRRRRRRKIRRRSRNRRRRKEKGGESIVLALLETPRGENSCASSTSS